MRSKYSLFVAANRLLAITSALIRAPPLSNPVIFRFTLPLIRPLSPWVETIRFIPPGGTVFDVGANTGGSSIFFANSLGRSGKVHAFEPVPLTFDLLRQRVRNTRLDGRVVLNNSGVSDRDGFALIKVPNRDLTQASLVSHHYGSWSKGEVAEFSCKVTSLDNYLKDKGIKRVDFVKIDVEGAELLVLKGMEQMMSNGQPSAIMLEAFPQWMNDFGYSMRDLFSTLGRHGYDVYFMGAKTLLHCKSPSQAEGNIRYPDLVDFMCVRRA